jgi:hypothetical protein
MGLLNDLITQRIGRTSSESPRSGNPRFCRAGRIPRERASLGTVDGPHESIVKRFLEAINSETRRLKLRNLEVG